MPLWTALGHATDHTLADSLAQQCLPTPSAAAAELVARAQAARTAADELAPQRCHQVELAASRRRARCAIAVAIIVALVAVVVVLGLRP